jgi:predicted RNA-binding protein with RPS1 domain
MFIVQSGLIRRSLVAFSTATVAEDEDDAISLSLSLSLSKTQTQNSKKLKNKKTTKKESFESFYFSCLFHKKIQSPF